MTLPSNFVLIIGLILFIITVVYFLLPRLNLGRYTNAYLKTAVAWCAIGYVAYDQYNKGSNLTIVFVLILGALVFAYTAFNAKEKK
jgi:hypothetical protein